jgi:flagellin
MTRVNTNVGSLIAQTQLTRTQGQLQTSLTRLSTGLRINGGKDDPAGLIASESLRSDITSINKALSNTQRAGQIIATADSALGQVSSLLNDMRGLITEAANNGALSESEIAANQLQVDASLEAINRISQSTTFQGRKLLDGSLDFLTSGGTNFSQLSDVRINQANLGSSGSVAVSVNITTAATQATLDLDIPAATEAANSSADLTLTNTAVQATGTVNIGAESFTIDADVGAAADGAEGNAFNTVTINYGAGSASSTYDTATNTLTVNVTQASGVATVANVKAAIDGGGVFTTSGGTGANTVSGNGTATMTDGRDAGDATIKVVADTAGTTANGVTVTLLEDNAITNNTAVASIVGGNIEVAVRGTVSYSSITAAINNLSGYAATITSSTGDQNYIQSLDTPPAASTMGGGVTGAGGLAQDAVVQLAGKSGSQLVSFKAGTSASSMASAINLVKDATGIEATVASNTLTLTSTLYGTSSFINLEVIDEGVGGTITSELGGSTRARDIGSDVVATINGTAAKGDGNRVTINTSALSLSTEVTAGFTGNADFTINGGGALFQLGPNVVSSQQARLGISSVNTGSLSGTGGRLYQLGSGESFALKNDASGAATIIEDVIQKVAGLRGRLGAFQRTTLDANSISLSDTLSNLTEAESSIRDADFAKETASLTRSQILVQSGTAVLGIANQSSQSVLSLLR